MTETDAQAVKRYTPRICPKCGTRDSCVIPAPGLSYYVCDRARGGCGFASEDLVSREGRERC